MINDIPARKHFVRLLGLGTLTVALVILAADRGVATSGPSRSGQQDNLAADHGRQGGQARQEGQRPAGASQPRVPWWKDPVVIKELGLLPDQAAKIEALWTDREKKMSGAAAEHEKQQDELNRMMEERKVGPETIGLQVDRVEAQRTALNKSWTVMIYQFSLVMTPEQNKALQAYRARTRRQER